MEALSRFEVCQPAGFRKRGRPAGKARTPLSLSERRARNAQYEKERRIMMHDALEDLARAANLDPAMTPQDVLAEVVNFLRMASQKKNSWDADALRRCNNNLASQIATLEHRLATEPELQGCISPPSPIEELCIQKRKWEGCESQCPPSKRVAIDQRISPQWHYPVHSSSGALKEELRFPDEASSPPTYQLPCSEPVCHYQSAPWTVPNLVNEEPSTPVSWEWFSDVYTAPGTVKETSCEELWAEILNASASSSPRISGDGSNTWAVDDVFLDYFVD